jgi:hypothetical protein
MAAVKLPTVTQDVGRNDDDDIEEDLLDVQADIWMSIVTSMVHSSGDKIASSLIYREGRIVEVADFLAGAYMDRFKNGLPGQEPSGSRSDPPPSPVKGRDPKAGDDD